MLALINKMRKRILFILLIVQSISVKSQDSLDLAFINSIVQAEVKFRGDRQFKITSFVEFSQIKHHLVNSNSRIKSQEFISRYRKDTLRLEHAEITLINEFFTDSANLVNSSWTELDQIPGDDYFKYLSCVDDNVVLSVSRPLFIRNNQLGICFFSSLTGGGGISGTSSLSIYKKKDGVWTRCYDLSSGMF